MGALTRYEVFKSLSAGKTIRETHDIVHQLWDSSKLADCDDVDSTGDAVVQYLFREPFKPERDYYEEVQPHVQIDEFISELVDMVSFVKKHRDQEGFLDVDGVRMLDLIDWNMKGFIRGNRFCRHPRQKVIKYS